MVLDLEQEMERRFAKFQPVPGNDDVLEPGSTRLALYYDETGTYQEFKFPAQRDLVSAGTGTVEVELTPVGHEIGRAHV